MDGPWATCETSCSTRTAWSTRWKSQAQGYSGADPLRPVGMGNAVAIGPDDTIAFAGCGFAIGDDSSGDIFVAKVQP